MSEATALPTQFEVTLLVKMLWLLFGPLYGKIGLLLIQTSGHTVVKLHQKLKNCLVQTHTHERRNEDEKIDEMPKQQISSFTALQSGHCFGARNTRSIYLSICGSILRTYVYVNVIFCLLRIFTSFTSLSITLCFIFYVFVDPFFHV